MTSIGSRMHTTNRSALFVTTSAALLERGVCLTSHMSYEGARREAQTANDRGEPRSVFMVVQAVVLLYTNATRKDVLEQRRVEGLTRSVHVARIDTLERRLNDLVAHLSPSFRYQPGAEERWQQVLERSLRNPQPLRSLVLPDSDLIPAKRPTAWERVATSDEDDTGSK